MFRKTQPQTTSIAEALPLNQQPLPKPSTPQVPDVSVAPAGIVGDRMDQIGEMIPGLPVMYAEDPLPAFDKLAGWVDGTEGAYIEEAAEVVRRELGAAQENIDADDTVKKANQGVLESLDQILLAKAKQFEQKKEELKLAAKNFRRFLIRMTGDPESIVTVPDKRTDNAVAFGVFILAMTLELLVNYVILQKATTLWTSVGFSLGVSIVASFAAQQAGVLRQLKAAYLTAERHYLEFLSRNELKKEEERDPLAAENIGVASLDVAWEFKSRLAHWTLIGTCTVVIAIRALSIGTSRHPNWGGMAGSLIFVIIVLGYYLYKVTRPNAWRADMMPEFELKQADLQELEVLVEKLGNPTAEDEHHEKISATITDYEQVVAKAQEDVKSQAEASRKRRELMLSLRRDLLGAPNYFFFGYRHFAESLAEAFPETDGVNFQDTATATQIEAFFLDRRASRKPEDRFPANLLEDLERIATTIDGPVKRTPRIGAGDFIGMIEKAWAGAQVKAKAEAALEALKKAEEAKAKVEAKKLERQAAAASRVEGFQPRRKPVAWTENPLRRTNG